LKTIKYHRRNDGRYECDEDYEYYSPRYGKRVHIAKGTLSDGATGALDIHSSAWWVHDELCRTAHWSDLTSVGPWQCACVLSDILWKEGHFLRAVYWKYFTYFLGCRLPWKNVLKRLLRGV